MENNIIVDTFRRFAAALKNLLRETVKLPWFKTYLLFSIIMIIVFVIITFPYNSLIKHQVKSLEGKTIKSVILDGLDFSLIGDSRVNSTVLILKNNDEISIRELLANISFISLAGKKVNGDLRSEGVRITSKKFITDFSANANLDFELTQNKTLPVDGEIKLNLNNVMLKIHEIQLPDSMGGLPLKIKPVRITSLILNTNISKGRIRIKNFNVSGNDLKGKVTGEINLSSIFKNSKLNLNISVDGDSKIFDEYREMIQAFMKNNRLEFKLTGTLARPRTDFKQKKSQS